MELYIDVSSNMFSIVNETDQLFIQVVNFDGERFDSEDLSTYQVPVFPDNCYLYTIGISNNSIDIGQGQCVFIDENPNMPNLEAKILTGSVTGNVDWKLEISYTRSGRNDITIYSANDKSCISSWVINNEMYNQIRGGQAVLTCYSHDLNATASFSFGIRAHNPDEFIVENYIENTPGSLWYFKYVAKHESGPYSAHNRWFNQFNEAPLLQTDADCGNPLDIKYTPNAEDSESLIQGFGLYMLTKFYDINNIYRVPNEQELWDWQENANSGTNYLLRKQNDVTSIFEDDKYWAAQWYLQDTSSYPANFSPPDVIEGDNNNVTLSYRSEYEHKHAMAMKRYNGLGTELQDYCRWDYDINDWIIHRIATYDYNGNTKVNYYVNDVCSTYE